MKTILCYGDSLTWGYDPKQGTRYPFEQRWPNILEVELGSGYRVIEEALNGRTVATDSWVLPNRSGRDMLAPILETHAPLDLVILMLGSNDTAPTYRLSASDVACGCATLIWTLQKGQAGPGGAMPQILLIAPPPVNRPAGLMELFLKGGEETSKALPEAYRRVAEACGCHFLDASQVIETSEVDGVHLDPPAHRTLALAVKKVVEPLLSTP